MVMQPECLKGGEVCTVERVEPLLRKQVWVRPSVGLYLPGRPFPKVPNLPPPGGDR